MKKSALFLMTAAAVFSFTALSCEKKQIGVKNVTLVMAEVNPESTVCGRMDRAFKEKVEELSNGTVKVDIRYSGVIGDEAQVLKMLFAGDPSVQMGRVSANLSSYGAKKSKLINIPYTFSSGDHFWTFAKSDLAKSILLEPYEEGLGVRGLCYAEEGFRHFFATQKISSVEDMKGKKTRVAGSILSAIAEGLHSDPVKVPFTDLFLALQTGTVEVADQPLSNYEANSFYKAAPFVVMDGHMLGGVQIVISSGAWDSLSPFQQKAVEDAAAYASDFCRTIVEEQEAKTITKLKAEGVEFVEVKDIKPWQTACKSVIEESSKDYPELYKQILDMAQ